MRCELVFNDITLTPAQLSGGVNYTQTVNAETDIMPGCTAMAEISFSLLGDATANIYAGKTAAFRYSHASGETVTYINGGTFTVFEVKKQNEKTAVRAYDNMYKFDIDITDWLNGLTYPLTLNSMLSSLCTKCGVTRSTASITNSSFMVQKNIEASNITGRTVLGWIAQIAASFAYIGIDGKLYFSTYTNKGVTLDNTKYIKYTKSEFRADVIDKVQLKSSENDIGVIIGTGTNTLAFIDNPLVYAEQDSEIRPAATAIYNVVSAISYLPYEIFLFDDFGVSAGDIITINGEKTIVMSKRMQASGVTLSATGNKRREVQTSNQNMEIVKLRGRTNELTRTIEETVSRLTDSEGNISALQQTATSMQIQVNNARGDISELQITANSLTTRVSNAEGNISAVTQTANKINWLVQSGTNSSNFTLTPHTIDLVAQNINMTGYVTYSSLSQAGQTTINGSNITTGTISTSRLAVTSGYVVFASPIQTTTVNGLEYLYFSQYDYITKLGTSTSTPLTVYSYAGVRLSGGAPMYNNAYILTSDNWRTYITGQTAVFG